MKSSWIILLGLALSLSVARAEPVVRWTMVNVSPLHWQADCHLIEFPDGRKVLIDIGDAADAPGRALAYLKGHGVHHLSLVVISHFHEDHYNRLRDVIEAGIRVDRVAGNVPADRQQMDIEHRLTPLADWDDVMSLLQFLRDHRVPFFTPKAGDRLIEVKVPSSSATASLDVIALYDGVHTPIGRTDINDTSIILRLAFGRTRALFTGDLNRPMGMYLALHNFDLAADILKVPHHGTEGAAPDEFFDRVHPKAALVPGPRALWWSMRSKRIRTYFSEHHIPAYVSGINGDVTVTMTPAGFSIRTER